MLNDSCQIHRVVNWSKLGYVVDWTTYWAVLGDLCFCAEHSSLLQGVSPHSRINGYWQILMPVGEGVGWGAQLPWDDVAFLPKGTRNTLGRSRSYVTLTGIRSDGHLLLPARTVFYPFCQCTIHPISVRLRCSCWCGYEAGHWMRNADSSERRPRSAGL